MPFVSWLSKCQSSLGSRWVRKFESALDCGAVWYPLHMTKQLEEVVADVRELPAEDQDRVAEAMLLFLREWRDDGWHLA
jgi:hypothetical protein